MKVCGKSGCVSLARVELAVYSKNSGCVSFALNREGGKSVYVLAVDGQ